MARVTMRVDETLGKDAPPLTQSRVRVRLRDGRTLTAAANGARGYPAHPATDAELAAKFLACAGRVLPAEPAARALSLLQQFTALADVRELTAALASSAP
jgi:2-methylcitrate dehydratase PrpD